MITLQLISSVFGGLEVTRGMRWGNMGVLEDHVLRAQVISTFAVKHKIDCVFNCLDHFNCFSVNLVRHQSSGTLSCELLNTDQYRNATLLADSSGNRHLFFKVHIASVFVCVSDASAWNVCVTAYVQFGNFSTLFCTSATLSIYRQKHLSRFLVLKLSTHLSESQVCSVLLGILQFTC